MNTKLIKSGNMAELFFEIGLALKLKKIPLEEVTKHISVDKVKNLADKIDKSSESNWDDSHITPGERLEAAIEVHETSQAELAKMIGVSPQKINDLIAGRINFSKNLAKKIATVLNISYKVFI
jgi:DNA-binding XRE family transcriptional regulator